MSCSGKAARLCLPCLTFPHRSGTPCVDTDFALGSILLLDWAPGATCHPSVLPEGSDEPAWC